MRISEEYEQALKKRVVQDFMSENSRAPSKRELLTLMKSAVDEYPTLDSGGFAAKDIETIRFQEESSAEKENKFRHAAFDDLQVINQKLSRIQETMEMGFRGLYATAARVGRGLDALEARVDNLILLNESSDLFTYGFEESFDTQDHVDWDSTTASVESSYCTVGRTGYGVIDLADVRISTSVSAQKGYSAIHGSTSAEHLKEDDGVLWERLVYTDYSFGRVSLVIELDLPEAQDVTAFRFSCTPVQVNKQLVATVYYSTDGKNFVSVDPQERPIKTPENEFCIGASGVKKLKLVLSKSAADSQAGRQGVYVFSLDSVKVYSSSFSSAGSSTLVAGPYETLDEEGNVVSFSRATCDACYQTPKDTSVSLYLSNDGTTWQGVSTRGNEGARVAVFESASQTDTYELIDEAASTQDLVEEVVGIDLDEPTEAALNMRVKSDYRTRLIKKSVVIKRNIVTSDSPEQLLEAPPGWSRTADNFMKTTLYVQNPEGFVIDLGHTTAFLNGNQVSGKVFVASGYQEFKTGAGNFQVIASGARDIKTLRKSDPLYPYNHRYLVEGYVYPTSFTGEMVYPGVGEYFASALQYVSPEEFTDPDNEENLDIYTIDESTSTPTFKVKVLKSDSTWSSEKFSASWLVSGAASNRVWVKAVLQAYDNTQSPVLESFKVRVI
jgi:hypothetical protein